jgi:hypothetical protein
MIQKVCNKNFLLSIFALLFMLSNVIAQPTSINTRKNPYKWMFGVSWNVVDDDGNAFTKLLDYQGSWNYLYYPSRISIDKYLRKGWSLEGMIAYNSYTKSKLINDTTGVSGIFLSGDFHVKYSFYRFFAPMKWFDPYVSAGLGFTYRQVRDVPVTPTCNIALGANFWFSRSWGIQIQTMGKLGIVSDIYRSDSDYIQHSIGIMYRKQPSKKPNHFNKRRYGWTNEKQRFKRKNT